jgi:precorrin-2 dehydrogenase/sirohydrochlorin ferrochelatase
MKYYPIQLDIRNRNCLVIGGGSVGTRKISMLLKCGARVTVVSPQISEQLRNLSANNAVSLHERAYTSSDLDEIFLAIGATDDETINRQISQDAEQRGILCNIADRPEICNFILPAIVQRGDMVITISTSGQSPAMAKNLRKQLENQFGEEYAEFLLLMGAIRRKLLQEEHAPEAHKPIFESLINSNMIELVREKRTEEINSLLQQTLGDGFSLAELEL